ncbi:MAG: 7-cyano-7-deazaguanine synthase [Deltaproteobacteria bacterium]|nr:7-cyano-7-deazaguanine synthase [Deltaproteobacteria bacterium]
MGVKAVALLSGGLDSTLAVKMMIEQGVEVYALNFTSAFCTCNSGGKHRDGSQMEGGGCRSESRRVAGEFGIPIKVMVKGMDYIEIVRNPSYGYGKGMNPCVDCRIYMFRRASEYMKEIGASFIITGEVLGQRPMSQRRDAFRTIEKDSGLEGLILRPLCAKHLPPTIPELTGLVDRERLLAVSGRSRKPQMEAAEELDVRDYPCPSGGCLLTEKLFSKKVKDLLTHKKEIEKTDLALLKLGRHFRYNGVKVIVGRDEAENIKLKNMMREADSFIEPLDFPGPAALVTGDPENGIRSFAGGLILRYAASKARGRGLLKATRNGASEEFEVSGPVPDAVIEGSRVC